MNWLELLLAAREESRDEEENTHTVETFGLALTDIAMNAVYGHQIQRIARLLAAVAAEANGAKIAKADLRTLSEGIHAETFRRLRGRLDGIDALLAKAEVSKDDRDRWFGKALTNRLRTKIDGWLKVAA
jgi:hypothetical protein